MLNKQKELKIKLEDNGLSLKELHIKDTYRTSDDDVINDSSFEKLAQDASLLMRVNNKMAHTGQPKPKNMTKQLYDSGV